MGDEIAPCLQMRLTEAVLEDPVLNPSAVGQAEVQFLLSTEEAAEEIRPGIVTKDSADNVQCRPIRSRALVLGKAPWNRCGIPSGSFQVGHPCEKANV